MSNSKTVTIKGETISGGDYELTAEVYEEFDGGMILRTKSGSLVCFKDGQVSTFSGTNYRRLAIYAEVA
jgi:hypothetical protein